MRVLVYEHLSSLPVRDRSLRVEGQAMLTAVLADLAGCPAVEPVTLVEPALVEELRRVAPAAEVHLVAPDGVEALFRRLAREAAFSLVIAPEFDDLLAVRCEWALEEGSRLLGPTPETVRLCADKLRLAEHLRDHRVPTPATTLFDPNDDTCPFPAVVKLRHGAGAQAVFWVHELEDLHGSVALIRQEGFWDDLIVQPFVDGHHGSVALVLGPYQRLSLVPAEQALVVVPTGDRPHGRLRYQGGKIPLPARSARLRAAPLAERVANAIPGLAGYVGVDVILDRDEAGTRDVVIEINPRLTTSYVGLRRLACGNLMQVLLDVVGGKPATMPRWQSGPIEFNADGTIT